MSEPHSLLWQRSAHELAAAYQAGTATPIDALAATLARLEQVNPALNAIITLDRNGAFAAAEASAARWRAGKPQSTLDGIPLTVKDNILVRGLRATWGSRLYAGFIPEVDETPVQRIRDAGAIIIGKTNVPEFTLHGYTDNALFGPTRNPWNLALTPGGSSGGGVAAVATGIGPLAICTDGGGSIRRPAGYTGLVGFKPSRGLIPREHGFPAILHDFEVCGPVGRNVDDVVAAAEVMSGEPLSKAELQNSRLRVLYASHFSNGPVASEILTAVDAAADDLKRFGCSVTKADNFELAKPIEDVWRVISQSGLAALLSLHEGARAKLSPAVAEMASSSAAHTPADYEAALAVVRKVGEDFHALFEDYNFLLTPTSAAMPWPATQSHPQTIDGVPVGPRGHAVFTPFANALGLPALSLPCRIWPTGLPIGFQIVGRTGDDQRLLALGRAYEAQFTPEIRWPPLT